MQYLDLTTIDKLKYGDRFYFLTDKKKEVWQVNSTDIKHIKCKGFLRKVREVTKLQNICEVFATKKNSLLTTNVVFLRNIFEDKKL